MDLSPRDRERIYQEELAKRLSPQERDELFQKGKVRRATSKKLTKASFVCGSLLAAVIFAVVVGSKINEEVFQTAAVGEITSMSKPAICMPSSQALTELLYASLTGRGAGLEALSYQSLAQADRVVVLEKKLYEGQARVRKQDSSGLECWVETERLRK